MLSIFAQSHIYTMLSARLPKRTDDDSLSPSWFSTTVAYYFFLYENTGRSSLEYEE